MKNYCLSIINIRSSQPILTCPCALSRIHRLAGQNDAHCNRTE